MSAASDFLTGHLEKSTLDRIHKQIYHNLLKVPTIVWPNQLHSCDPTDESLMSQGVQEATVDRMTKKFANNISFIAHKIHRHEQEAQVRQKIIKNKN